MVASYLELYGEAEVEHINGPSPSPLINNSTIIQAKKNSELGLIVGSFYIEPGCARFKATKLAF